MVEQIDDMPAGTIGFRAEGDLTGDDYRKIIVPPLRATIDSGEKIRMLFVIGEDFRETPSGLVQDIKAGGELGVGHLSSWERTAVVTDQKWVKKGLRFFGWMAPGEVQLFPLAEEQSARTWVSR
ncbi:MAG: STAS/SEC14 domain-containing protein [Solirubrobacterales bacterium]